MKPDFQTETIELLVAARKIADFAKSEGIREGSGTRFRERYTHLGAVLADSILQAGVRYTSVVLPRVNRILVAYPNASTVVPLASIVQEGRASEFLDWRHPVKTDRFERLVCFISEIGITDVEDLRSCLLTEQFCSELQCLNGVGPKTVDYMSCLVGIDAIAVDRHVRAFAANSGVHDYNYKFLRDAFCFAADLLTISRREFDAWLWRRASGSDAGQIAFSFGEANAMRT